ncbi:MAG: thermonuclease family protein [Thermoleophilaceae bacterium]
MTDVSDGDTITLSGTGRVRLIGADTPEVFGGTECFGRRASGFTKRVLTPGRRVRYRLGIESRDRYGRALAYVWLRDGRMFNGLLVLRGYALPLAIAPNVEYARRFRIAARRARRARRGLWGVHGCARDAAGGGGSSPGRDRDCGDFPSQAEAQRYFERHGGRPGRNVDQLDAEGDGRVCESLP